MFQKTTAIQPFPKGHLQIQSVLIQPFYSRERRRIFFDSRASIKVIAYLLSLDIGWIRGWLFRETLFIQSFRWLCVFCWRSPVYRWHYCRRQLGRLLVWRWYDWGWCHYQVKKFKPRRGENKAFYVVLGTVCLNKRNVAFRLNVWIAAAHWFKSMATYDLNYKRAVK